MKKSEKKTLLKHIQKDDKEFRAQIKDDVKLKKQILSAKSDQGQKEMKKAKAQANEKKHEAKEGKRYEKLEDKREAKKEASKKKK